MGCRCKERGQAIIAAARSIRAGDTKAAASQIQFVGRTMVQDAKAELSQRMAAAKARLQRR